MASEDYTLPGTAGAEAAGAGRDTPELSELERRHHRFVWPMTVFFLVYYMLLMVLPGLAPGLMEAKVVGNFTVAYLFALSQFVMTFLVAWLYTRFARQRLDPLASQIRARIDSSKPQEEVAS